MTEILVNPSRRPRRSTLPAAGSATAVRAFHRRLPGYETTPLVAAPDLAARCGVGRLWVKDESTRLGLPAFKILGASWAIYRLLVERLGREPEWSDLESLRASLRELGRLRLVAATDGNHGRAVAHVAALLGYDSTVLVPRGTAVARIAAIESEGAVVTIVDGTYDDAVAASAELAGADTLVVSDTSWPGYETVPNWVIEGYGTIFAEVDEVLDRAPDVVIVQMGVGALAAAVVDHYAPGSAIVAVEPESAACGLAAARAGHPVDVPGPHDSIMAGLNCGRVSLIAWPRLASGIDVFVAVSDLAAEDAMRALATIGIVAGETGGSGLAGLAALAAAGTAERGVDLAGADVLVLCTEGATDPVAYNRIVGTVP